MLDAVSVHSRTGTFIVAPVLVFAFVQTTSQLKLIIKVSNVSEILSNDRNISAFSNLGKSLHISNDSGCYKQRFLMYKNLHFKICSEKLSVEAERNSAMRKPSLRCFGMFSA